MNAILGGLLIVVGLVAAAVVFNIVCDWKRIVRWYKLRQSGVESIAWVIMVDEKIRTKRTDEYDDRGSVGVLIAADRRDEADGEFMLGLGDRLEALWDEKPTDPDLKALRREIRNNKHRDGVWHRLPDAWTDGAEVYYTSMQVFRENLPKQRLKRRYVRCLVDFDRPDIGAHHVEYHPEDDDDCPYRPRKSRRN
jgi:hypothetical protein